MIGEKDLAKLIQKNDAKIVMVIMDGLGDTPDSSGKTALETASCKNLDKLTASSETGLTIPVAPGITPGSGPSHLSVFGYDPVKYQIGRGVLEALGIALPLGEQDLAVRSNFATIGEDGLIKDRRAGRIATSENERLCALLKEKIRKIEDVEVNIYPGKEHRFVVVFTGFGMGDQVLDADPEATGVPAKPAEAYESNSEKTARIANEFIKELKEVLKDEEKANYCLLRGFAKVPPIASFADRYSLSACAIASYPMYKGLARLVGMQVIEGLNSLEEELDALKSNFKDFDFFYFHVKKTDSYGEDGNRAAKVSVIEEFDAILPSILDLKPDVICITADHSTPTSMSSHSWHPNPVIINGPYMRNDASQYFSETEFAKGNLGIFYAKDVMQILLAQAGRLKKYGA